MMYESQRIVDDVPFVLKQDGKTIGLRSIAYDKGVKVPGYPTQTRAHFLIIDTATPLDPTQPFNLTFKLGRRFGTFPNQKAYVEFPLPYYFHGWRQQVSNYLDADWVGIWIKRGGEIAAVCIALTLLSVALIRQRTLTATTMRLTRFRVGFLLFTLIGIGWVFQGQLSIVNIIAAIDSIAAGNDLSFFLTDPITVILWIFVGFTLFIWGRGTFCGWLCPFGAFQELVSKSMRFLGLRHKRIRPGIDRKLKWIKYILLLSLLSMIFISPSTTEIGVEVEPFKTAISLYFVRDWPYVLWAVTCLLLSVVVYRGYCRYICPLGAALAAFNPLRKWGWIARRAECGTPCQTCRSRCDYQAIDQVGHIAYSECFQCMDCVSIYQDKKQCLPLVKEIKRQHIVIQIHAVSGNL
jgi:polyferredoxin